MAVTVTQAEYDAMVVVRQSLQDNADQAAEELEDLPADEDAMAAYTTYLAGLRAEKVAGRDVTAAKAAVFTRMLDDATIEG
jgi:hypothetical protein